MKTNGRKSHRLQRINFASFLDGIDRHARLTSLALLVSGIIDQLERGVISAEDALALYFHVDNITYTRRALRNRYARELIERGAQLDDLFTILPPTVARREFKNELRIMRSLCERLIEKIPAAA